MILICIFREHKGNNSKNDFDEVIFTDKFYGIFIISQFIFTIVACLYFYNAIKKQKNGKSSIGLESEKESARLRNLRSISLSKPLSEVTRPKNFSEIVGQESGIKAITAALCGPNPQHIIIYGPPGVGKTAAARLALEYAKKSKFSPFKSSAKFVELDATILQFDERSIADPLIGSVHDPIYQGAGAYGSAGIPRPREGAVTKAHGGVLFIDEIGEMSGLQMNKLLKVLEDGKVFLTSSYYSESDTCIPSYIHDIFQNGLPADFRLIGATTRLPEEIPPALRSRCTEIYFNPLKNEHIVAIVKNSVKRADAECEKNIPDIIARYSQSGRDAVNIVQSAVSIAAFSGRKIISEKDVFDVIEFGKYSPKFEKKIKNGNNIGVVNGLAVCGSGMGTVLEIEAECISAKKSGEGEVFVTGIIETEEIKSAKGVLKRKATAKCSVENAVYILQSLYNVDIKNFDIHINITGGMPVDGPSAGVAVFAAVYSAVFKKNVTPFSAMTGEIGIKGEICPVGGVSEKIEAAVEAGAKTVIIPFDNYRESYSKYPIEIIKASHIDDIIKNVIEVKNSADGILADGDVLTAEGM